MSKQLLTGIAAGALALGGLAGCAAAATPAGDLNTVSMEVAQGAGKGGGAGGGGAVKALGRHALHGEVVVQGKSGPQTIVAQRGQVTAKADGTLTVRSSDGFTITWTTNGDTKMRKGSPAQIAVGAQVAVGGVKGDPQTAKVIRTAG